MQKIALLLVLLALSGGANAQSWNADSLGNHRAVVSFDGSGEIAHVKIVWRRRDVDPGGKRILVQDGKTGSLIGDVQTGLITRESGEIGFRPVSGKGLYYVYYMPYRNEGRSNYPRGNYLKDSSIHSNPGGAFNAHVIRLEAVDPFNSFDPMELIATGREMAALQKKYAGRSMLIWPEDRLYSIRMVSDLPARWISRTPGAQFSGTACRGEYFAFQLGVYAMQPLQDVQVVFEDLIGANGHRIGAGRLGCINTNGITYDGKPLVKQVDVTKGTVQAMWCGVDVPKDAVPGVYSAVVRVKSGKDVQAIPLKITIRDSLLADGGAGRPETMSRLKWLNSTLAQENTVIAPYTPLEVAGDTLISLLGRTIQLNKQGFPEQIQSYFTPEMTEIGSTPHNLLAENIHFHFTRQSDGKDIRLTAGGAHFTLRAPGTLQWEALSRSDELNMNVQGSLEFDGSMVYSVKVEALQDLDLKEVTMHIPFSPGLAEYMMGLGLKGGKRPDSVYQWHWDVAHKNQDGAWIGTVNAGLQYSLRDERYVRPLNTNFYLQKPLLLPSSWGNEGRGGITVGVKGRSMLANNYSGARTMKKGEVLYYNFNLLITPFHPINTDFQWATRFYHRYNDPDSIKATGASVVNIHHATPINPWINYPFIEWKKMKDYIDKAHRLGLKVKIYNTVRELSDHAYETFALRSLGHEIYSPGRGGGFSWLQEHIGSDYIAAWFVPEIKDAALVNSGMSRWHNYYVEGMNWLTQNAGIDGIYLDDVAFDRVTMKRIKRVLTQSGHPGIIDLHSANQYNKSDGFNNSANLYMEHFPYLNRLWFGEYFDYEHNGPDFFLTEVSGIPFGLMGEMLEGGGNPWRGMVFGMTNRMPWTENADPRPIWHLWDEFGMRGTKMIGYWSPSCPVKTGNDSVPATVYKKDGAVLVALASWANEDTSVRLQIDWKALGIDMTKARIVAPAVKNFQDERSFSVGEAIPVLKGKGWLLTIK